MTSTDAGTTSLLRWRPAVLGLTVVAGALTLWYAQQAETEREDGTRRRLHRSNAVRRRSPRLRHARPSITQATQEDEVQERSTNTIAELVDRRESFAGTLELPDDDTTVNAGDLSDGQSLLNMLYHIAVEQANREGYVHRGVTCNACNALPIRGVRYRCANCPDYDLCEQCESLGNVHDRTHLFYKIRIPAPFLGANPRQQQPVWYPGKPHVNPRSIPNSLKRQLSDSTGLDRSLIDALWDQFKTLAGCDWPEDPNGLCVAIDREIWAKYCITPLMKNHTPAMSLLFDRSLAYWDDNADGLIGFEEFLNGLAVKQSRNRTERYKRTFRAYDLDSDGFVTRQDFMSLFVAHYAYCKELSRDRVMSLEDDVLEGSQLRETLQSTQAVSSCFHGNIPPPEMPRVGEGKTMSSFGDLIITDGGDVLKPEEDNLVHEAHDGGATSSELNQTGMADIFESLSQGMLGWPPEFVTPDDAQQALGKRLSLRDITEAAEQRRVIDVARRRLEQRTRTEPAENAQSQLDARWRSLQVIEGGEDSEEVNLTWDHLTAGQNDADHIGDFSDQAAPLTSSVTQEFLYQKSAEGLNELLDPMFKQLEDLQIYHTRSEPERTRLADSLKSYKLRPGNLQMCQTWLDKTLQSWRQGDTLKAWIYGDDLAIDILARLQKESQIGSQEWMWDFKERIRSGFTTEEEEDQILEKLQKLPGEQNQAKARELRHLSATVRRKDGESTENDDGGDPEHQHPVVHAEDDHGSSEISTTNPSNLPAAVQVPSASDRDQYQIMETSNSLREGSIDHPSSRPAGNVLAEIITEAGSIQITGESRVAVGPIEILSEDRLQTSLANDSLSGSDGVVVPGPESLADLDEFFANQDDLADQMEIELTVDPTLPHHRPHSVEAPAAPQNSVTTAREQSKTFARWSPVCLKGSLSSMEERDPFEDQDSDYFRVKLKYLVVLELYADKARERGGWAKLNAEEFDQVMSGRKGQSLMTIGTWLDTATF